MQTDSLINLKVFMKTKPESNVHQLSLYSNLLFDSILYVEMNKIELFILTVLG